MKGYYLPYGYMGYLPSSRKYRLFATMDEYAEVFKELESE